MAFRTRKDQNLMKTLWNKSEIEFSKNEKKKNHKKINKIAEQKTT